MSTYVAGCFVGIIIGIPSMIILHHFISFLFPSNESKIKLSDRDKEEVFDMVKESFITGGPHCGKEMIHHWVINAVRYNTWYEWTNEEIKDLEVVQDLIQKCSKYADNWWDERHDYENKKRKKEQNNKRLRAVRNHLDKNRKKPPLWARELF